MLPLFLEGLSLSRSYRVILPSSFNIVISYALVFSTIPPASVFDTVLFLLAFLALSGHVTVRLYDRLNRLIDVGTREYPSCSVFTRDTLGPSFTVPSKIFRLLDSPKPGIFGGTFSVLIATYASICSSGVN